MNRRICLLVLAFLLFFTGAQAAKAVSGEPDSPALISAQVISPAVTSLLRSNAKEAPVLKISTPEAWVNETFYLSWSEKAANLHVLFEAYNGGDFRSLGYVDAANKGYEVTCGQAGKYTYCLMTKADGEEWKQSDFIDIEVKTGSSGGLPILRCNVKETEINKKFYLSWHEPSADLHVLLRPIHIP